MVSRESVNEVFLLDKEDCLEYLRDHRWPDGVTCPYCESTDTIKKGTTRKGTQRYRCRNCDSIFNDLTATVFSEHQLSIPEMFHIIRGMEEHTTNEIFQELDRTYKTVLASVVQGATPPSSTSSAVRAADKQHSREGIQRLSSVPFTLRREFTTVPVEDGNCDGSHSSFRL